MVLVYTHIYVYIYIYLSHGYFIGQSTARAFKSPEFTKPTRKIRNFLSDFQVGSQIKTKEAQGASWTSTAKSPKRR
jgi:hypothetical protein